MCQLILNYAHTTCYIPAPSFHVLITSGSNCRDLTEKTPPLAGVTLVSRRVHIVEFPLPHQTRSQPITELKPRAQFWASDVTSQGDRHEFQVPVHYSQER